MGIRVDRIAVQMDVYVEFEGRTAINFEYVPKDGDPLVAEALRANHAILLAQVIASQPKDIMVT